MANIRFPGLIDVHVHLRDPGANQKEDFTTGSRSAVVGGFTFVIDMPNNPIPTISIRCLKEKEKLSRQKSICDIGFHYGTDGNNLTTFPDAWSRPSVFGLKVYCDKTTGTLLIQDEKILNRVFMAWKTNKPILAHAVGETLQLVLKLSQKYQRRLHVCHVSQKKEIDLIRKAKKNHTPVTSGVTPHHLFLTQNDARILGPYGQMKPEIGNVRDREALWTGLSDGTIDIVESDHAPHAKAEKESENSPSGVPGLETTFGLLLLAVHDRQLTLEQLHTFLYDNPRHIFDIPEQKDTYIEFDYEKPYIIGKSGYETKCGWSPFHGREAYGKVETVVFKGRPILDKGSFV